MAYKTTDLCDEFPDEVRVVAPILADFGARVEFHGSIETVRVFEDNVLVRRTLEGPGEGRVLVVDGGGSAQCALLGDRLAALGHDNGWSGVVVFGCVRDVADLGGIDFGVKALAPVPRKSAKEGTGEVGVPVEFGGVVFEPGDWLYADADGVVVSSGELQRAGD